MDHSGTHWAVCLLCNDEEHNTVMKPCNHISLCQECGQLPLSPLEPVAEFHRVPVLQHQRQECAEGLFEEACGSVVYRWLIFFLRSYIHS